MNTNSLSSYIAKISTSRYPLWKKRTPLLGHLDIELTERCNNNCIHCYINLPANDNSARQRELNTAEIKDILTEATDLGALSVRFTGGEPLLREDFEEIYFFARRLGLKVFIFTNATLITPRLAECFKCTPPLENIEVTVYGMKKKSYEAITRTIGSFEAAWRGINILLQKRIPFVVKGVILPPNREEIEEFDTWASTIPWMEKEPPLYAMFFDFYCRQYPPEPERNLRIARLRLSPEEGIAVLTRQRSLYLREMQKFCFKFMGPPGKRIFSCGAGKGCCVDAYGAIQPCLSLRHPDTVCNLKTSSLEYALISFFPRLRQIESANQEYLHRCARCFLKGLCEQCPAKSWTEHRTLDTLVEYHCKIAHAQARYLGLLKENEVAWKVKNWRKRLENSILKSEFL